MALVADGQIDAALHQLPAPKNQVQAKHQLRITTHALGYIDDKNDLKQPRTL
jgi:hypothetical protein